MKKTILILLVFLTFLQQDIFAQQTTPVKKYGKTLNAGFGIGGYTGYYAYVKRTLFIFHLDYEFDIAQNFTLAPFVNFYTYRDGYYWGSNIYTIKNYYFHETVIPVGIKAAYYFDQWIKANPRWDFYVAASVGFSHEASVWDKNYHGDPNYYRKASPLFLDGEVGAEYRFNKLCGVFLEISSGASTIGVSIH